MLFGRLLAVFTRCEVVTTIHSVKLFRFTDESFQFANYKLNTVPEHELEDGYLTVILETITFDKSGTENRKETTLVKYAILTNEERARLRENAELLNEAMDDYRAALEAGELDAEEGEGNEQDPAAGGEDSPSDMGPA